MTAEACCQDSDGVLLTRLSAAVGQLDHGVHLGHHEGVGLAAAEGCERGQPVVGQGAAAVVGVW